MLKILQIENIAIIESAALELSGGLNVLTGETGAGKSIIIDSINAVLGERTSRELIRTGEKSARVSALFENINTNVINRLSELDIEYSAGDDLLLSRSINVDGKNTCRINGNPVSVSMLKAVGAELVNIHGQHDNQALLSAEKHFHFIDALAENEQILVEYRNSFSHLNVLKKELKKYDMDEAEKARKLDILHFQIDEIENAAISSGEREKLQQERDVYSNYEKIIELLQSAYGILKGGEYDEGAIQMIDTAVNNLQAAENYLPEIKNAADGIRAALYDIEEHTADVRERLFSMDFDPKALNEIEKRLDIIYRLSIKYGETEEDILNFFEKAKAQAQSIELSDEKLTELQALIKSEYKNCILLSEKLTASRLNTAEIFEKNVAAELAFLDMPAVSFCVKRMACELNINGADEIEFLISANEGEEPKPLARIASGGELSRIMLALKNVLSGNDSIDTMIFDEIDAGVSGSAAQKVSMKLREVSKNKQVICVTHLAQIAAQAESHIRVSKSAKDGRTYTVVKILSAKERVTELARINGGFDVSEIQLRSAEEMLKNAGRIDNC